MGSSAAYMREWRKAHPCYNTEHSRRWREAHPEETKEHNRRFREKHGSRWKEDRDRVRVVCLARLVEGCANCGENDVDVLEFHHRNPALKKGSPTQTRSVRAALIELAKCDVLCANCHRRVTKAQTRARSNP